MNSSRSLLWALAGSCFLALAAFICWIALWQWRLEQAQRPASEIAALARDQRALFKQCETEAAAQPPRDPATLAIRAASCLSIRAHDARPLSPSAALLALTPLSSAALRLTLAGESPAHALDLADSLSQRAAAQALVETRALAQRDERVQALCQGPQALLCRLAGVRLESPLAAGSMDRLTLIHALRWRSEAPQRGLDWLASPVADTPNDPALQQGRARAQAALDQAPSPQR